MREIRLCDDCKKEMTVNLCRENKLGIEIQTFHDPYLENQDVLVGITKGLYPDIAKQYKTTASKVERAIRHAIESVWKKNGPQVYFEVAGYLPTEKPTNGQFIAALSEYFRIKEKGKSKKIS